MKIAFSPSKFRILRGTILLMAVVLVAYVAYAATQLTISNNITVTTGAKNIFQDIIPSAGTCPAFGSSHYTDGTTNSTATAFSGSISSPGTQGALFCIENTNNSPVAVTIVQGTVTPSPAPGSITITGGPLTIPNSGVASSSQTLTVSANVPANAYSFTITIS
ncbi:MAG TPA: hypothetical protein VGS11_05610 [Candidatus Bathyarchaeia archaeon]|nr:hypothetical protein [Candidatus Bathyarchaeia archaeon]